MLSTKGSFISLISSFRILRSSNLLSLSRLYYFFLVFCNDLPSLFLRFFCWQHFHYCSFLLFRFFYFFHSILIFLFPSSSWCSSSSFCIALWQEDASCYLLGSFLFILSWALCFFTSSLSCLSTSLFMCGERSHGKIPGLLWKVLAFFWNSVRWVLGF